MTDEVQSKVVAVLAVSSLAMLVLVLATPFVFFDERPGLPIYPTLTIDYIEENGAFIVLLTSVSGIHMYREVSLEINGAMETINYTYAIERHVVSDSLDVTVQLTDENDRIYSINITVRKNTDVDPAEFAVHIEEPDDVLDEIVAIDDFPYTASFWEVDE